MGHTKPPIASPDPAIQRFIQSQVRIRLAQMDYTNRYYDVRLGRVIFEQDTGQASWSMQGEVVSGSTFSYWFSTRHESPAKPGRIVRASCLGLDDIETAIKTGKLNDLQVFL